MAMTIGCPARPLRACPFPSYEHLNPEFSVVKDSYLACVPTSDAMHTMMSWEYLLISNI